MAAILAILLPLLAKIPGQIGEYFQTKQEIEKIKLDTERQLQLANLKLAGEVAKADLEKSKEIIKATGANFKYFTFFMWFGPFMLGVVWPSKAAEIFNNLSIMPQWYVESCMLIMFTVWGISVSAPVVGSIFSGLSSYMSGRREYKLEKAKIDRKAFFDGIKKLFPKGMNQAQVDLFDRALDEGEK